MNKQVDYLISAVRFNSAGTHIVMVRIHADRGNSTGAAQEVTRQTVVSELHNGATFGTIFKSSNGNWDRGQKVITETVGGQEYIKTRPDGTKRDNLDELPIF